MKNIITKFVNLSFLVALLISANSCADQLLDLEPQRYISDNASITDLKAAEAALFGLYNKLQHNNYYGGAGFQGNIFLAGGDGVWTGTWDYLNHFVTHEYLADNLALYNSWLPIYSTINQANHIISKVPDITDPNFTLAERNRIIGEALFIRSLAYFDLARTWANIPVVLQPTTSVNDFAGVKQSTQSQVYQQVLNDLTRAAELLPTALNRNHANRSAVLALRSRVHLYNRQWEEAEQYASQLIASTSFELIPWQTFLNNVGTRESIFELAFNTADASVHFSNWTNPTGRAQWAPSRQLFELLTSPETGGTRASLIFDGSTDVRVNYFIQKLWWRPAGDNPTYILRIAEQYLIRAEARARKANPDLTGALADLNAVRARSELPALELTTAGEILLAIENERRVEFAYEPHRWFDLVRTERAGEVLGVTNRNRWIFPIPFNDIQADPDLVQNPGY